MSQSQRLNQPQGVEQPQCAGQPQRAEPSRNASQPRSTGQPQRKYFATAARMDEAFLELIGKKDFAYITVKEICERAGVNRSTFYLHYETLDDLLAETAHYLIDQFMASMPHDTADFLQKLPVRPLEELYLITPAYLTPYLTYIKEHQRLFRASVEHATTLQMDNAYAELLRRVLVPILNRYQVPTGYQSYVLAFFIQGLMAVINEWLKNGCQDSIDHMVSVIQLCIADRSSAAQHAAGS